MNKKNLFNKVIVVGAVILIAGAVFGAKTIETFAEQSSLPGGPENVGGLVAVLCNILNSAFTIFVVVSIAFVLYAAFLYLTAGGNAEQVNKATKTLTYAAVAILVAILAKGFPILIGETLNVDIQGQCGGGSSPPNNPPPSNPPSDGGTWI